MSPETGNAMAPAPEDVASDDSGNRFALRHRPCPICGVAAKKVLGLRGGAHHRYRQGIESRIVRCHQCGLILPDPFPVPLDPQRLYGNPDEYFGESDHQRRIAAHRDLVLELAARLGRRDFSVLDVGSGRGEFLVAAAREGARAVGLETSEAMVSQGRERLSVEIRCQTIEEYASVSDRSFDAVTLSGVLEHVHDPDSVIACVHRVTRPGSIVYIDVPREPNLLTLVGNVWNRLKGSPAVYNLQPSWPPYHVFGFNPRSLACLLSKHGFTIETLEVQAVPHVPARDEWRDRFRALVATQIHRMGNVTNLAANMFAWARRR